MFHAGLNFTAQLSNVYARSAGGMRRSRRFTAIIGLLLAVLLETLVNTEAGRTLVGRAYGICRHAHIIASKEALNHLSLLRLGAELGFFPVETLRICDALLMEIQPAHLQLHAGSKLSPEQRDAIRAEIIRTRLQSLPPPVMNMPEAGEERPTPPDELTDS